jgi:hypothetical protein
MIMPVMYPLSILSYCSQLSRASRTPGAPTGEAGLSPRLGWVLLKAGLWLLLSWVLPKGLTRPAEPTGVAGALYGDRGGKSREMHVL